MDHSQFNANKERDLHSISMSLPLKKSVILILYY